MRANPDVSRISLRKEGEVALLESPNGLGATAVSSYAEKCQELNFLRFSAVGPHPWESERTNKGLFAVCPRTPVQTNRGHSIP
ncbi:MAG: hypothetical protein DME76_13510 [Verrucomicrobia bacterium]|nr:MAG: hypothetical protein DME76_13510 [Verrucomicrobiota bacterium]